jgi:hypothetical protein
MLRRTQVGGVGEWVLIWINRAELQTPVDKKEVQGSRKTQPRCRGILRHDRMGSLPYLRASHDQGNYKR